MRRILSFIQGLPWSRMLVALLVLTATIFNPLGLLSGWLRIVLFLPTVALVVVWFLEANNLTTFLERTTFLVRHWENLAAIGVGVGLWVLTSWLAPTGDVLGIKIPAPILALLQSTPIIVLGTLYSWLYLISTRNHDPAWFTINGSTLRPLTLVINTLFVLLPASLTQLVFGILGLDLYVSLPITALMIFFGYQWVFGRGSDVLGFKVTKLWNQRVDLGERRQTCFVFLGQPIPVNVEDGVAIAPVGLSFFKETFQTSWMETIEIVLDVFDKQRTALKVQIFFEIRVLSAYDMLKIGGMKFFTSLKAGSKENSLVTTVGPLVEGVASELEAETLFVATNLGALLKALILIHANNGEIPDDLKDIITDRGIDPDELGKFKASDYFGMTPDGNYLFQKAVVLKDPLRIGKVSYADAEMQTTLEKSAREKKERAGESIDLQAKSEQIDELTSKGVPPFVAAILVYAKDIMGAKK